MNINRIEAYADYVFGIGGSDDIEEFIEFLEQDEECLIYLDEIFAKQKINKQEVLSTDDREYFRQERVKDMLYDLENKGREEELEGSAALFADIQTEFDKLKSFLSRPNWAEPARAK